MDLNNILDITDEEFQQLDKEEREFVIKIIKEYQETGESKTLDNLYKRDYEEIPVDIHTFMHSSKYLGNALYDPEGRFTIFPYWEKKLKEIFPTNTTTRYNTIVFTGAIGLGKSTIAVICLLYMLYRLLCLRDPYLYYGMQPIDKISISLMNITLENAKGVALDKMNQMILSSQWFMKHGTMSGTTNLKYTPEKHIELITASSNNQVIGRAIFCLDGDTVIATTDGDKKLSELVDKKIYVPTIDENGDIVISNSCTVKPTAVETEEFEIELEDNSIIRCTPNHLLRLKDGSYKEARMLTVDDELYESDIVLTYDNFIKNIINTRGQWGIENDYFEGHHILPKCMGGEGNSKSKHPNIVRLYPREHFIAHKLLCIENPNNAKLAMAFSMMAFPIGKTNREYMLTPEEYDFARKIYAKNISGDNNPMSSKSPWNAGLTKCTDARVAAYSENLKNRQFSNESKSKMSKAKKQYFSEHDQSNKGLICITDGVTNKYVSNDSDLPEGWHRGNNTVGHHPKHTKHRPHKIQNIDLYRRQKSEQCSGENNPMYGKGYLIKGGKNGRADRYYIYNNIRFESRVELIQYLNSLGDMIEGRHIREWERGKVRPKIIKLYSHILDNLVWGYKNEN